MEAIVKRLSARLLSAIVIILLIILIILIAVALYRGQSIELWGLKIGETKRVDLSRNVTDLSTIKDCKDVNFACKEISAKYEHEISKIKKEFSAEYNLRSSEEKRINELEHELKVNRESIYNELLEKINAIQMKLRNKENELRNLQGQYEVAAKKYYPLERRCEKGESFYNMECKEAGELRGSLETIKLKIDFLIKSIENDNTAFNLLLRK